MLMRCYVAQVWTCAPASRPRACFLLIDSEASIPCVPNLVKGVRCNYGVPLLEPTCQVVNWREADPNSRISTRVIRFGWIRVRPVVGHFWGDSVPCSDLRVGGICGHLPLVSVEIVCESLKGPTTCGHSCLERAKVPHRDKHIFCTSRFTSTKFCLI